MRLFLSLSLFAFVALVGCDTSKKAMNMEKTQHDLTGSYTVKTMHNVAIHTTIPTFSFYTEDHSFRGNTGCNSVFGTYSSEGQTIDLSGMAVSEMYCSEKGVMEIEREFLDILQHTGSFKIEDNTLILYSKDDKRVLLEASIGITK